MTGQFASPEVLVSCGKHCSHVGSVSKSDFSLPVFTQFPKTRLFFYCLSLKQNGMLIGAAQKHCTNLKEHKNEVSIIFFSLTPFFNSESIARK